MKLELRKSHIDRQFGITNFFCSPGVFPVSEVIIDGPDVKSSDVYSVHIHHLQREPQSLSILTHVNISTVEGYRSVWKQGGGLDSLD